MSLDIVYQMEWFNNLLGSKPETAEVTAAKTKKANITKRCADEQTAVDKEIIDAKAKVNQVAPVTAVKPNGNAPLFSDTANTKGGKRSKQKFSKKRKGGKKRVQTNKKR